MTKLFGNFIKSKLLKNNGNENNNEMKHNQKFLRGEIKSYGDSKGLDRWIELAYTEWAEDLNDHLIQIEGYFSFFLYFFYFNLNEVSCFIRLSLHLFLFLILCIILFVRS